MAATRCPVKRAKKCPPACFIPEIDDHDEWFLTDYHDWTVDADRCTFCGCTRRQAYSAPNEPPWRPLLSEVLEQRERARQARRDARAAEVERLGRRRRGRWIANALNNLERQRQEAGLRKPRPTTRSTP